MNQILQSLIEDIRKRPGFYIGRPSATRLSSFLDGYLFCESERGNDYCAQFAEFRDWIIEMYPMEKSISWDEVLSAVAGGDEEGFRLFEQKWDEFLATKNR